MITRLMPRPVESIVVAIALAVSLLTVLGLSFTPVHAAPPQVPNTYKVNSTADEPDADPSNGVCSSTPSGKCTLRAAIMLANWTI